MFSEYLFSKTKKPTQKRKKLPNTLSIPYAFDIFHILSTAAEAFLINLIVTDDNVWAHWYSLIRRCDGHLCNIKQLGENNVRLQTSPAAGRHTWNVLHKWEPIPVTAFKETCTSKPKIYSNWLQVKSFFRSSITKSISSQIKGRICASIDAFHAEGYHFLLWMVALLLTTFSPLSKWKKKTNSSSVWLVNKEDLWGYGSQIYHPQGKAC